MNFFTHFKHSRPTPNSSCCNNNPTKLNSILYRILNKQMFNEWNRSTKTTEWKGEKIAPKWNDIFQPRKKSYVKWFFDRHSWHIRIFPFPFNHFFIFFFFLMDSTFIKVKQMISKRIQKPTLPTITHRSAIWSNFVLALVLLWHSISFAPLIISLFSHAQNDTFH